MKNQNSSEAINDNEILHGLKNEQFQPFFQPKVQCSTKKIVGSEALIRWVHPELEYFYLMHFLLDCVPINSCQRLAI